MHASKLVYSYSDDSINIFRYVSTGSRNSSTVTDTVLLWDMFLATQKGNLTLKSGITVHAIQWFIADPLYTYENNCGNTFII